MRATTLTDARNNRLLTLIEREIQIEKLLDKLKELKVSCEAAWKFYKKPYQPELFSIDKKMWTLFGDMFIKLPTDKTKVLIEKGKTNAHRNIHKQLD